MKLKKLLGLAIVPLLVSVAVPAGAIEIKFSGQVKNRGTTRDLNTGSGASYSNFTGANLTSFNLGRLNLEQNNPTSMIQAYGSDAKTVGRNLVGNGNGAGMTDPNAGNDGSASWWDTRAMLGIQAVVSENLKGVFLLQFGQYDWGSYATSVGTNNEPFLVNNAYIDFKIPTTPIEAVVGLAPMKLGHGVLLQDDVAMINLAVNLDSVKFQAFAIKAAENFRMSDDDDDIYGVSIDLDLGDTGTVGAYALDRRRNSGDNMNAVGGLAGTIGDMNLTYLGLTGDLKFGNISVACEAIWEHGKVAMPSVGGIAADDFDIDSVLGYLDIAIDLDVAKVGIAGVYATGNNNDTMAVLGGGENMNAFVAISPTDSYDRSVLNWDELFVREVLANNISNLFSPKIYFTVNPTDTISLTLQNQWYWRAQTADGGGAFNGNNKLTFKDNFIGKNIDVIANVKLYDQLSWRLTGSYMMTADDTFGGGADSMWQLRQALTFTF